MTFFLETYLCVLFLLQKVYKGWLCKTNKQVLFGWRLIAVKVFLKKPSLFVSANLKMYACHTKGLERDERLAARAPGQVIETKN